MKLESLKVTELRKMTQEIYGSRKMKKSELVRYANKALVWDTTKKTSALEHVASLAPYEFHYWNGDNEGLSIVEYLTEKADYLDFPIDGDISYQIEWLLKECGYILHNVWCLGSYYNKPNPYTLSGELYHEDKTAWQNTVKELRTYHTYLQFLLN